MITTLLTTVVETLLFLAGGCLLVAVTYGAIGWLLGVSGLDKKMIKWFENWK